jgi:hypothetical protein
MFRRKKYPGLAAAAKANGVPYATAYQRVSNYGWSFERATTEPTYVAKAKISAPDLATPQHAERLPTSDGAGTGAEIKFDTPVYIRKIRAALCDEFVKTGNLDPELLAKLKDYAYECRTAKNDPERISTKHEARRRRRPKVCMGDDHYGSGVQIDGDTT